MLRICWTGPGCCLFSVLRHHGPMARPTTTRRTSAAFPSWASKCRPSGGRSWRPAAANKLDDKITAAGGKKDAKSVELLPDVEIYYKAVHDALAYQEFFDAKETRLRRQGARHRPSSGPINSPRASPVDDRHRPRRSRLRLEDRRLGAAVRPRRARELHQQRAGPLSLRPLVPRPRRDAERAELHSRPDEQRRRRSRPTTRSSCIPTAATATPSSSPARSTCSKRSTRCKQRYRIDDDRIARPRLLDGRGGGVAVRRPLSRPLVRRQSRRGLQRDARVPQGLPAGERSSPPGGSRSCGNCTTAPAGASTCGTARRSPTAARSTRQKQAADVMQKALAEEGIDLVHIIGPQTKHADSSAVEDRDRTTA